MKGALMAAVHEDAFTLLSGGDALSEYNQNTGIARHFFWALCGTPPSTGSGRYRTISRQVSLLDRF
jgi:hypothetical protein